LVTPVSQLDQFLPDRWRDQQLKEIAQGCTGEHHAATSRV
jgi:hypothetical protein